MHPFLASPDRPLPSTIRGLCWTSFLTDLSSEAIYPLLPAYVMRELGGSAMSVGLLDGIANLVTALPMMLVIGIAYGCAEPAERALVAALAPVGRQGGAFGWYALVQGAMALPAGLLAGWLWQQGPHGPSWAFGATAALSVLACGLLMAPIGPTVVGSE